jgi:ribosomal protein S12 methylthiotransferase
VLIVNTCAFIDSAKEESIEAILQAHQERGLARRPGQKLIVSGCMSQRFSAELKESLPEVDAFLGLDQVGEAGRIIEEVLNDARGGLDFVTPKPRYIPDYDTPRFRLTPAHFAYVKIAEGCNHPCSFCVIPQMRGRHRSRTIASIVAEIRALVVEGVREFNLISQDTTYFGMDFWEGPVGPRAAVDSTRGPTLGALLEEIEQIDGDFWVRLLYTHPAHWSRELMETIAACSKVVRYIDMPLQHIHPEMLRRMRRETSREHIEEVIAGLRETLPGVALRTTFIAGFPGETEEHFEALLEFIAATRFERLGVFGYSREEGSRAAKFDGQIPAVTRRARVRRAMKLQQKIAHEIARAQVGKTLRVLTETPYSARTEADAPEVDCRVILSDTVAPGEFKNVRIVAARDYDLEGECCPA